MSAGNIMKTATELVSIITPMYNAEQYIRHAIESVLTQTYEDWEMIVIDDCSSDASYAIAASYAENENRIRLFSNNLNLGISNTRNIGLSKVKGRYIAFLDADDLWRPNKLEKQVEYMKQNGYAFCFCSFELIDSLGKKLNRVRKAPQVIDYRRLLYSNPIGCLSVVVDVSQTGVFQMPALNHEDYACWLSILKKGHKAYGINEVLASYRVTARSVSSNKIKSLVWVWNIYRTYLGISLPGCIYHISMYFIISVIKYARA